MDAIFSYERNEDEDYYKILECDEQSNTEQIVTEYKARVLACHPDKHPDDPTAAARFEKLQRAKDTLADPAQRVRYDQWRRSGIAMKFETWKNMRDTTHVSMHWAGKKPQPALQETAAADQAGGEGTSHQERSSHSSQFFGSGSGSGSSQPAWQAPRQTDIPKGAKMIWERDPASIQLQRFRNYDI